MNHGCQRCFQARTPGVVSTCVPELRRLSTGLSVNRACMCACSSCHFVLVYFAVFNSNDDEK